MKITVRVHPASLLSANHRPHWAVRDRKTRAVRQLAFYAAAGFWPATQPKMDAADITVTVHPPDRRRRDAHNTLPTIKAAIDGFVDARLLPDDSDKHVRSLNIRGGEIVERGMWVFTFELEEPT